MGVLAILGGGFEGEGVKMVVEGGREVGVPKNTLATPFPSTHAPITRTTTAL